MGIVPNKVFPLAERRLGRAWCCKLNWCCSLEKFCLTNIFFKTNRKREGRQENICFIINKIYDLMAEIFFQNS